MTVLVCPCGAPIPPKKPGAPGLQARWCTRECWVRWDLERQKLERQAKRQGRRCRICGGPMSEEIPLNGLYCSAGCKTLATRHSVRHLVCPCGAVFASTRKDARFCSRQCCQRAFQDSVTQVCEREGCGLPKRAKGLCISHYNKSRRDAGLDPQPWSDKRRDTYHRRRAQKKATANDRPVLLSEIRERDGNRCHLCRKKVSTKPYPHPLSASLDHIVPLSLDGEHVPENVRLAHLRCNVAKGNGGGNEQLLLIG